MDVGDVRKQKNLPRAIRRRKKKTSDGLSQIWILQARVFENDQRTSNAKDLKVYLVPGREYTVGKNAKLCDVVVSEDKSVSGTHAKLKVYVDGDDGVGHVLVTDTSTWGTSVSKDGKNLHKEEKLSKGCAGKAYDGYLVKFGVYSPFQVIRTDIAVYIGDSVDQGGRDEIQTSGLGVLRGTISDEASAMVVGGAEVVMDDDILLAILCGVPIVTLEWVRAWSRSTWVGKRPQEREYMPRLICGSKFLDPEISEHGVPVYHLPEYQGMMEYVFIFPWGDSIYLPMTRIFDEMGLHYCEEVEGLQDACAGPETPVVVLQKRVSKSAVSVLNSLRLPSAVKHYCLLEDLRRVIVYGDIKSALRSIKESDDADGADEDGWHLVERGTIDCGFKTMDQNSSLNTVAVSVDEKLVRQIPGLRKSKKGFVKQHHTDPGRDIIELVVMGKKSETANNDEWAEMEREKMEEMMRQKAFEHGGKKPPAKKRTRRNAKNTL
jgi:hypothetical protein